MVAAIFLCVPINVSFGQVLGENLNADLSISNQIVGQEDKTPVAFARSSTVFSLSDELQFKPGRAIDQNNFVAKAEFWSKGFWGVSGNIQQNTSNLFGLPKDSDSKRIDVNRKLLRSQSSDSFLALGVGWQTLNIDDGLIDSDGLNVSLLGRYALTENLNLYGNGSFFQEVDNDQAKDDLVGFQVEASLNYQLGSRLSFSAGFKISDLDGQENSAQIGGFSSSLLIGTSLSF